MNVIDTIKSLMVYLEAKECKYAAFILHRLGFKKTSRRLQKYRGRIVSRQIKYIQSL